MTENEFKTSLTSDGFQEIEHQQLQARPGKGRHRHLFEIRGLVLSGTFIIDQTGDPVTYGAGEIFAVRRGHLHDEWVGEGGAEVLVGRKFSA